MGLFDLLTRSPGHCTGFKAMAELERAFPSPFELNYSVNTLEPAKILR